MPNKQASRQAGKPHWAAPVCCHEAALPLPPPLQSILSWFVGGMTSTTHSTEVDHRPPRRTASWVAGKQAGRRRVGRQAGRRGRALTGPSRSSPSAMLPIVPNASFIRALLSTGLQGGGCSAKQGRAGQVSTGRAHIARWCMRLLEGEQAAAGMSAAFAAPARRPACTAAERQRKREVGAAAAGAPQPPLAWSSPPLRGRKPRLTMCAT